MPYPDNFNSDAFDRATGGGKYEAEADHAAAVQDWADSQRGQLIHNMMALVREYFANSPLAGGLSEQEEISIEAAIEEAISESDHAGDVRNSVDDYIKPWESRWVKRAREERHKDMMQAILAPLKAHNAFLQSTRGQS